MIGYEQEKGGSLPVGRSQGLRVVMAVVTAAVTGVGACLLARVSTYAPLVLIALAVAAYVVVSRPFWALSGFVATRVLFGPVEERFTVIPGVLSLGGILNIVLVALFLVMIIRWSLDGVHGVDRLQRIPYVWLYIVYVFLLGLSSLISPAGVWSLKLFSRSLSYFIVFMLVAVLVDSEMRLRNLYHVLKFTLVASLLGGIGQVAFGWGIPVYVDVAYPRYTSMFFTHPNAYANFLGYLFFPVFCVWYFTKRRVWSFDFFLLGLTVIAIIATYSRAVWVSFAAGLICLFLVLKKDVRVLTKVGIMSVIVVLIFWQPILVRMSEVPIVKNSLGLKTYHAAAHFDTMGERFDRWGQVFARSNAEGPRGLLLGHGTGSVMHTFQWSSHNNYVDIFYDNGIMVLLCYLMLLVLLFRRFFFESRRVTDPFERGMLLGASVTVLVMVITGLAESNRIYTMQQLYFWIVMGLGSTIVMQRKKDPG